MSEIVSKAAKAAIFEERRNREIASAAGRVEPVIANLDTIDFMKRDRILQWWKALPMAEIKATSTCIEGIVFDSQTLLQSNEEIAQ